MSPLFCPKCDGRLGELELGEECRLRYCEACELAVIPTTSTPPPAVAEEYPRSSADRADREELTLHG